MNWNVGEKWTRVLWNNKGGGLVSWLMREGRGIWAVPKYKQCGDKNE